ncbi:MAG: hypothetical protein NTU62_11300 [Spirochaetes bacterium]|nr:hypothetical protein [Spirochaetota bacterium]
MVRDFTTEVAGKPTRIAAVVVFQEVGAHSRWKAWAGLPAKVHELDVMACPRCGFRISVIAVITAESAGAAPMAGPRLPSCVSRHVRGKPPHR